MTKTARPKVHTPGEIRYFTYWLTFPDGETWVDQAPIVHDLVFTIKNSTFAKNYEASRSLLQKGEYKWKDRAGVEHYVKIENFQRPKRWGTKYNIKHRTEKDK